MSRSFVVQTAAILALVAASSALPQINNARNPRIAGGAEASDGQFPFQVALINEGLVYCGGSVVNRRWIVTAAACLTGKQLSDVQLFLGSADRLVGGRNVTADRFVLHPNFDQQTYANDIALIRVRESLAFATTSQLQPIELATEFFATATDATVSGWGRFSGYPPGYPGNLKDKPIILTLLPSGPQCYSGRVYHPYVEPSISNNQLPTRLQFIRTDIIDSDECAAQFEEPYASRVSEQRTICTSNQPEQGVCLGDAGGPLVLDGVLVGVQSWSIPCGLGLPDVYERVSHHRPWILAHALL